MQKRYLKSKTCPYCGITISPTPFFKNKDGLMQCNDCGHIKEKKVYKRFYSDLDSSVNEYSIHKK